MAVRGQVADHLLDEMVLARSRRRAVQHGAAMFEHIAPGIGRGIAHDARGHCDQVQLAQRAAMAPDQRAVAAPRHFVGEHLHVIEHQAAAGRHPLPHAVPVVDHAEAGTVGRDDDEDVGAIGVAHVDARVVGKGGAGGVVLLAAQAIVVAVAAQRGGDFPWARRAALGRCTTEDRALDDAPYLQVVERRARRQAQRFGLVEVDAQRMRDIRFLGRDGGDDLEQVDQRCAQSAPFHRQPKQPEAGLAEQREALMGQHTPRLARGGVDADLLRQRRHLFQRGTQRVPGIEVQRCVHE